MYIALIVILIFAALILFSIIFMLAAPVFGGTISKKRRRELNRSKNYVNSKFVNQIPTFMNMGLKENIGTLRDFMKKGGQREPGAPIPVEAYIKGNGEGGTRITWFGHSAFLLEIDGKVILIDPMFGKVPSPFPMIGGKRYSSRLPIEIKDLPKIDIVLLSHNHYDHLDYGTILKIKNKVDRFITPLGVGTNLEKWGITKEKISEHDWWDKVRVDNLNFVCTPARHFSGRSLLDRNGSLWCSWVINGQDSKIFFSGDSGYAPHFKEVGEKYGPFDVTLMECGQYDKRWAAIHMMPEESVQAHLDVKGKVMIPIHWGAFTLALHSWTDPVERASKAAKERGVVLATPRIGETVELGSFEYPSSVWWRAL